MSAIASDQNTTNMANAIRALSMDAVQQAKSGHPGAPMGMAEMAVALWARHLKHNPNDPQWLDRDRFVLSNGHGSMLIYALLHLTGYDLPMEEIKNFRQLHSKTAGHPEVHITPGVETTTGPLGQGITNAVGFALAEKLLSSQFNRPNHEVVNHHTYVFLGDGCLMEGISHEACSLAGSWKLNKLIALYDDNGISIDGQVQPWFGDNTPARFASYGWHVIDGVDGHDVDAVDAAIAKARQSDDKPTLIVCKTHIGKGSPNMANTSKVHGSPLGADEIAATRKQIGWEHAAFDVPQAVYNDWDCKGSGAVAQSDWEKRFHAYEAAHPELAAELKRRMAGDVPAELNAWVQAYLQQAFEKKEKVATRKASQFALEMLTEKLPEMVGGSADLTGSNLTNTSHTMPLRMGADGGVVASEASDGNPSFDRFHINYGVREFGMAAIMNGMALHGGLIPYGGTFLTFSDYSRNAIRMAALMRQRVVHVFTHDSIGLGEDGPTHQAVEHAASLRLIPNLDVWRPADVAETAVAWQQALLATDRPTALLLTRQGVPYAQTVADAPIARGGYVLKDAQGTAQVVLIATGSEIELALGAQEELAKSGIQARVVSMPCTQAFDRQDAAYQREVLLQGVPRIAIEMGSTGGWWKYGCEAVIGLDEYGESAPAGVLFEHFGFTVDGVVNTVTAVLSS